MIEKQIIKTSVNQPDKDSSINSLESLPVRIYLGGSFDPIHNSHIAMLNHVYHLVNKLIDNNSKNNIDSKGIVDSKASVGSKDIVDVKAIFLPTSRSPLKQQTTSPEHRLEMIKLVSNSISFADEYEIEDTVLQDNELHDNEPQDSELQDSELKDTGLKDTGLQNKAKHHSQNLNPKHQAKNNFHICQHELWQSPPTYSIDTLKHLSQNHKKTSIIFILGADNIASLHKWRDGDKLTKYANLWIIPRDKLQTAHDIKALLPDSLKKLLTEKPKELTLEPHGKIFIDTYNVKPISSSDIRTAITQGKFENVKSAVPHLVYSYIIAHHLYQD